ncbi:MAG: hypothetical protein HY013_15505 [Candidatus Solibacter usitatus]|nr:hypothetical protein [Candidatus Solibacter usitatus]
MQRRLLILTWASLGAAAAQQPALTAFTLEESDAGIQRRMGAPRRVSNGPGYRLLEYQTAPGAPEAGEFDFAFYFERPAGILIRVTRTFSEASPVDHLFPAPHSRFHRWRSSSAELSVRSCLLDRRRVLLAIGVARPGDRCRQLVLIRRSALSRFYPWLAAELP